MLLACAMNAFGSLLPGPCDLKCPRIHRNSSMIAAQDLVDRFLPALSPLSLSAGGCAARFTGVPCIMLRSPFHSPGVRHHHLSGLCGITMTIYDIAARFTALHTLLIDCSSFYCSDWHSLSAMTRLRCLTIQQFPFTEDAFNDGIRACTALTSLQLHSTTATLLTRRLRHLVGLSQLSELLLLPRGYVRWDEH